MRLSAAPAYRQDRAVVFRWTALAVSSATTLFAAWLFVLLAQGDGWTALDAARLALSSLCVFWLTWGTMGGMLGLFVATPKPVAIEVDTPQAHGRTAILMPIYNEDPPSTFARVAAMSGRLLEIGAHGAFDIFILSDSQSLESATREALWLERLLTDCPAREQIFYRRRPKNSGRKAGNIEDFIRHSGAAYEYAIVLDADSLMEADAIVAMVQRIAAAPQVGLLQTLPEIVHARSVFGRALQFAATVYTPVFARGTALMQGGEGPYWGHNAIFRIRAFAQSCGLPQLHGNPPFGGHILSHDYVEAALLARAGHAVLLDPAIGGSFEEGPDNIMDFAKRDQRWCQGNLQHSRIVMAPALHLWNRITLLQGIFNYLMPPVWLALLIVSIASADIARPLYSYGYYGFERPGPDWAGWALIGFVAGILILPKLLIATLYILSGRAKGFGSRLLVLVSVMAEIALSTITAPIVLMFQVRAVLRVVSGFDGGWPPSNRKDGTLTLGQAMSGSWWITCCGAAGLAVVMSLAPALVVWSLPVALPMILAPFVIAATSRPLSALAALWQVPSETTPSPVLLEWERIHAGWTGAAAALGDEFGDPETANVLG